MKKIVPVLLLASLSIGSFAAYYSKTIKDVKATCSGDKSCNACKKCKYCKHCKKDGATCGVCKK